MVENSAARLRLLIASDRIFIGGVADGLHILNGLIASIPNIECVHRCAISGGL
jgi:hypothetical protein